MTHLGHKPWWLALQKVLDKGAFEDYTVILRDTLNKNIEDMDNKEKDTIAIVNYLQGKKSVSVDDIKKESGANGLRVYPILFELEQSGVIEVTKGASLGAAEEVRLVKV